MLKKIILTLIICFGLWLRVVDINKVPPGVYLDEATIAYNAYSIGFFGKDQFGMSWPVYFRSMVEYKTPLYVYLTVLPVKLLGMTPIAIRIVSIISGILIIWMTYLLMQHLFNNYKFSLLSALFVSIVPWAILNSRSALEPNLALAIYLLSLYLFHKGLRNKLLLPVAFILLALTNYAYNAYRFFSLAQVILLFIFHYKSLLKIKKIFFISILLFIIILIPQLLLLTSAGGTHRYQLLSYTSEKYFQANGGDFQKVPFGQALFIVHTFLKKYVDYLSPKSIFFDADPIAVRGIPELAAFYPWMVIPFFIALVFFSKKHKNNLCLFLGFSGLISIIPAGLTTDNLYEIRVLPYLWVITLIVAFGLLMILQKISQPTAKGLLLGFVISISLVNLYINYFHILREEEKVEQSGTLNELFDFTYRNIDKQFIVDLSEPLAYGVALYEYKLDPRISAQMEGLNLKNYYNEIILKKEHQFKNLSFRRIDWVIDTKQTNFLLVGDERTISDNLVLENKLKLIMKFSSSLDPRFITIYQTNP